MRHSGEIPMKSHPHTASKGKR